MRTRVLCIAAALVAISLAPAQADDQPASSQAAAIRSSQPVSQADAGGTYGDVILDGDASVPNAGVILRAKATRPFVAAQSATSDTTSGFTVFNSANTELLRVRADGNVGIGTSSPRTLLHVVHNASGALGPEFMLENNAGTVNDATALTFSANFARRAQVRSRVEPDGWARGTLEFWTGLTNLTEKMRLTGAGDFGIGTVTPQARLNIAGANTALQIDTPNSHGFNIKFRDTLGALGWNNGILMDMLGNSTIHVSNIEIGQWTEPIVQTIPQAGDTPGSRPLYLNRRSQNDVIIGQDAYPTVGLRVESKGPSSFKGALSIGGALTVTGTSTLQGSVNVSGDLTVAGNVTSKYQDVAEWVPSDTDLEAGTVVVLSPARGNAVMAATRAYDTTVAGVVSSRPGLILGEADATKEMVATTGRVRVKVDATSQPVAIGDLLVTSDSTGYAMKSVPVDLGGISMHRPGTIVGKALEALPSGRGEILVLLSLQ